MRMLFRQPSQDNALETRTLLAPLQIIKHGTGRGMLGVLDKQMGLLTAAPRPNTSKPAGQYGGQAVFVSAWTRSFPS